MILFLCYRFPKDPDLRKQWVTAIKRIKIGSRDSIWTPGHREVICSKHFLRSDFVPNLKLKRLKPTAIPSVFSHRRSVGQEDASTLRTIRYVENYGQSPIIVREPRTADEDTKQRIMAYRDKLRNARKREDRAKKNVENLRSELLQAKLVNENLHDQLEIYKGKIRNYGHAFIKILLTTYAYVNTLNLYICNCHSLSMHTCMHEHRSICAIARVPVYAMYDYTVHTYILIQYKSVISPPLPLTMNLSGPDCDGRTRLYEVRSKSSRTEAPVAVTPAVQFCASRGSEL